MISARLPSTSRSAFTLIELMVVMGIILLLLAMLIPVMGMIQKRAMAASTNELVMNVTVAMKLYADEDARHFYPTPAASGLLPYDSANTATPLGLLERSGWNLRSQSLDVDSAEPINRCLVDGWGRAIHYRLDGPVRVGGVIDASAMNGTADKPAPQADWNPRGSEPWAYVWSLGQPSKSGDAADANPSSAERWIYERGSP